MNRRERRLLKREMGKFQKKMRGMSFPCLAPGCKNSAIKSHSQQKEGQLRAIARQGMVYALERNFYRSVRPDHVIGLTVILTGIAEASTFPGFCSHHDKELFSDLEDRPLTRNDPTQALLLFLRGITYEYAQKRKGAIWLKWFLSAASGIIEAELIEEMAYFQKGMEGFVDFDGPFYLRAAFDTFKNNLDWLITEWEIIPKNVMASCSCCFSPLRDDHVDYKLNHPGEPGPLVVFNLVPEENQTHIIISWHEQDSKHTVWIREAIADRASLEGLINECAIAESEDTCFSPDLWESIPEVVQNQVKHAMRKSEFRGSLKELPVVIKV